MPVYKIGYRFHGMLPNSPVQLSRSLQQHFAHNICMHVKCSECNKWTHILFGKVEIVTLRVVNWIITLWLLRKLNRQAFWYIYRGKKYKTRTYSHKILVLEAIWKEVCYTSLMHSHAVTLTKILIWMTSLEITWFKISILSATPLGRHFSWLMNPLKIT
jgi:hypothetical protein